VILDQTFWEKANPGNEGSKCPIGKIFSSNYSENSLKGYSLKCYTKDPMSLDIKSHLPPKWVNDSYSYRLLKAE
jgi:hypothetical protein